MHKVKVNLYHSAIRWKLWWRKLTVLEISGEISIYQVKGSEAVLQFKSESNMMIMYKNPCFLFRDIIFCSTSASVGLIVRTSYWLLGWNIEKNGGKLTRALDQVNFIATTQSVKTPCTFLNIHHLLLLMFYCNLNFT